jgi:hypothetical protein
MVLRHDRQDRRHAPVLEGRRHESDAPGQTADHGLAVRLAGVRGERTGLP